MKIKENKKQKTKNRKIKGVERKERNKKQKTKKTDEINNASLKIFHESQRRAQALTKLQTNQPDYRKEEKRGKQR